MKTTNKKNNEYCSCEGFSWKVQLGPYKCSKCGLLIPMEKMAHCFIYEAKKQESYKVKNAIELLKRNKEIINHEEHKAFLNFLNDVIQLLENYLNSLRMIKHKDGYLTGLEYHILLETFNTKEK